jgi:hypothetical protein
MTYAVQSGDVLGVGASATAPVVLTFASATAACSRGRSACDESCSASYIYESYRLSADMTVGTLLPGSASVGPCRCYTPLITSFTSSGVSGILSEAGVGFTISTSGRDSVVTIPDLPGCSLTYTAPAGVTVRWPTTDVSANAPNAPASSAPAAGPPLGALIGGAVGGVLLLAGVAAAVVLSRRGAAPAAGGGPVSKSPAASPGAFDAQQQQHGFATANPMAPQLQQQYAIPLGQQYAIPMAPPQQQQYVNLMQHA